MKKFGDPSEPLEGAIQADIDFTSNWPAPAATASSSLCCGPSSTADGEPPAHRLPATASTWPGREHERSSTPCGAATPTAAEAAMGFHLMGIQFADYRRPSLRVGRRINEHRLNDSTMTSNNLGDFDSSTPKHAANDHPIHDLISAAGARSFADKDVEPPKILSLLEARAGPRRA